MSTPEAVIEVGDLIRLQRAGGESLVLGPGLSTLRWYQRTFCAIDATDDDDDARLDEVLRPALSVPDGSNGVLFLPGSEGGAFFGMTYQTVSDECTRAVYEGLVHSAVTVLKERGDEPRALGLTGPRAGNALWCELFAKATGIRVTGDGGTVDPDPASIRVHTALHALHRQCMTAIAELEVVK